MMILIATPSQSLRKSRLQQKALSWLHLVTKCYEAIPGDTLGKLVPCGMFSREKLVLGDCWEG